MSTSDDICVILNEKNSDQDKLGHAQVLDLLFEKYRHSPVDILDLNVSSTTSLWPAIMEASIVHNTREEGMVYDVIIDSMSTTTDSSLKALREYYPHLKDGGYYIMSHIEDDSIITNQPGLVGCLCNQDSYFFTGIRNKMCVITKKYLDTRREAY
jgi:hypothetical protein